MKKVYPSIFFPIILLLSVNELKAHNLSDSLVTMINIKSLSSDILRNAGKPIKKKAYQIGVQIEHIIRTGYSNKINYQYKPVLIQFEFQKQLLRRGKREWQFDYFIQPQFNTVSFSETGINGFKSQIYKSFEIGVNAGIVVIMPLLSISKDGKINMYALGSLGPHYVGSCPSRQVKGFLFSNNMRVGLRVPISSFLIFDLRTGIRHLSNANLKSPNGGLDAIMYGAGIKFVKL